ncbi:rCG44379 [Rattus norvegicus]|uniref:RCG44379 n=1 Tax=Rattus norvegicus TaxID=10116 RepID=A6I4L5_RAT|nr:rCG44379 [Rattus norvegicus]
MGGLSPSSRRVILPTANRMMLVLGVLWSLLVSSSLWKKLGPTHLSGGAKGSSSLPFLLPPMFLMGANHDNSLKIVRNTFYINDGLATWPSHP